MSFLRRFVGQDIGLLVRPLVYLAVTAYWLYWRWVERRPMTEFAPTGAGRAIRMGAGVVLLAAASIYGFLWFHGNLLITAGGGWRYLPQAAAVAAVVPEEILCRGLLFRLTEEKLGSAVAVLVSSGLFGLAHYANPGATLLSALGIGLQAGLGLAAAYMLTRTLWAPIAAHFMWDFIAGVLGLPGGRFTQAVLRAA